MKIKITSDAAGVHVELTTDPARRPVRHTFGRNELRALLGLLDQAARAETFKVEVEYGG